MYKTLKALVLNSNFYIEFDYKNLESKPLYVLS